MPPFPLALSVQPEWTPPCQGGDHGFKSRTERAVRESPVRVRACGLTATGGGIGITHSPTPCPVPAHGAPGPDLMRGTSADYGHSEVAPPLP